MARQVKSLERQLGRALRTTALSFASALGGVLSALVLLRRNLRIVQRVLKSGGELTRSELITLLSALGPVAGAAAALLSASDALGAYDALNDARRDLEGIARKVDAVVEQVRAQGQRIMQECTANAGLA